MNEATKLHNTYFRGYIRLDSLRYVSYAKINFRCVIIIPLSFDHFNFDGSLSNGKQISTISNGSLGQSHFPHPPSSHHPSATHSCLPDQSFACHLPPPFSIRMAVTISRSPPLGHRSLPPLILLHHISVR